MTTLATENKLRNIFKRSLAFRCPAIVVAEFGDYECDENLIEGDNFVINVSQYELSTFIFEKSPWLEISSLAGLNVYRIPVEHIVKVYLVSGVTGSIFQYYDFTDEDYNVCEKIKYGGFHIVKSILGYQGNKNKIADELFDLMPPVINRFFDVFGGSAVMSVTAVQRARKVIYNDYDKNIVGVLKYLRDAEPNAFIKKYDAEVAKHGLFWDKKTPSNIAKCKANYYKYKEKVNKTLPNHPFKAFVLSKHAYCGLFRFNLKDGFNYAYGERGWADTPKRNELIHEFLYNLSFIKINRSDWRKFTNRILRHYKTGDFVYLDPPYLASGYNVYKGNWTEQDEFDILRLAKKLDRRGVKVMISNVITHRGLVNKKLVKFIKTSGFKCIKISEGKELYSVSRITTDDKQDTVEVALINY